MKTTPLDPRITEILQLVSQLSNKDFTWREQSQNGKGDALDRVLEGLNTILTQRKVSQLERADFETRVSDLTETMVAITSLDFTQKAPVGSKGDAFDTIAVGLNTIAEKLEASMVSRTYLNNGFQSMFDSLLISDLGGKITVVNQSACRLLGYREDELLGRPINDVLLEPVTASDAGVYDHQERLVVANYGLQIPVSCSRSPLRNSQGEVESFIYVAHDITGRKQTEEALRQSEAKAHAVLDALPDMMFMVKRDGTFVDYRAPEIADLFVSSDQIVGKTISDLMPAPLARELSKRAEMALDTGQVQVYEYQLPMPQGTRFYEARFAKCGESEVVTVARDITERKQAEMSLRSSQERLQLALSAANAGVWEWNATTGEVIWSDTNYLLMGLAPNSVDTHYDNWLRYIHPEDRQMADELVARHNEQLSDLNMEFRVIWPDGSIHWIHNMAKVAFNESGQRIGTFGIQIDITQRKQAEAALRESESLLQKSQAVGHIGSYYLDVRTGKWISSPMLDELFGIAASFSKDLEGWISLVHPDEQQEMRQYMRQHVLAEHRRFDTEYRIVRHDNQQECWVHGLGELEFDDQGNPIKMIGTIQDITQLRASEDARRRTEMQLRESEKMLQLVLDTIPARVFWKDHNSVLQGGNRLFAQDSGFDNINDLMHKPGKDLPILAIEDDFYQADDRAVMTTGVSKLDYEETLTLPGREPRVVQTSKLPLRNDRGDIIGILGVYADITARKKAEAALEQKHWEELEMQSYLKSLHEITIRLNRTETLDDFYRIVVEQGLGCFGFERMGLLLYDAKDGAAIGTYGTDADGRVVDEHHLRLDPGNLTGILKRTLDRSERFAFDEEAQLFSDLKPAGVGQNAVAALWNNEALGWLAVDNRVHHKPITETRLEILALYALTIGSLLARKRAEFALRESEAKAQAVLAALPDLMFVLNHNGAFVDYKAPETADLYVSGDQIVGKTISDLMPAPLAGELSKRIEMALDTGKVQVYEYQLPMPQGMHFYEARFAKCGETEVVTVVRAITERKKAEAALRESEFLLQKSQAVGRIGSYYLDTRTGKWINSPMLDELFGIDASFPKDIEGWISLVHPAQREEMRQYMRQHVLAEHQRFDKEYRIIRQDNQQECWVYGLGELEFDDQGSPIRMIGTIQDITESRHQSEALQRSESRFRALVENSPDYITFVEKDYRVQYINRVAEGARIDQIVGANLLDLVLPDYVETVKATIDTVVRTGKPGQYEVQVYGVQDNTTGWLATRVVPFFEAGQVANVMLVTTNITERKRAEDELWQSQQMLRLVMNNIPSAVCWKDRNSVFLGCNGQGLFSRLKSPQDIIGLTDCDMPDTAPQTAALYQQVDQRVMNSDRPELNFEELALSPDGSSRWMKTSKIPLHDAAGAVMGVLVVTDDITERKRAEDELWQSRQMLQLILDHIPSAVLWKDRNCVFLGCNRQAAILSGLESPQDIIGLTDYDPPNSLPENAASYQQVDRRVMNSDRPELNLEELALLPKGPPRWMRTSKVPLHDAAGSVMGVLAVVDDITERKQAEDALRRSEAQLRAAQEIAHIGNWDWNIATNDFSTSDEIYRIYGLHPEKFKLDPTTFMQAVHPDDRHILEQSTEGSLMGQQYSPITHRIVRPDGHIRWVEQRGQTIFDEHGKVVRLLGTTQDVTERIQAESERQKLVDIVETSSDFIAIADLNGQVQYVNPAGLRLVGIGSLAEARGLHVTAYLLADEHERFAREHVPAVRNDGRWLGEVRLRHFRTGEAIPVDTSSVLIRDTASREPVAFANISRDITERKRAEAAIQQLNRELERRVVERTAELEAANEEIKNFAYIVSHDLRAPLVNLKGFAAELRSALQAVDAGSAAALPLVDTATREAMSRALQEDIPEALQYIESSVTHMDGFTKAILKLSRLGRQQLELVEVDVRSLVQGILRTLAYQISERGVQVTIHDLPSVTADQVSMEQIVGNILGNAVAYLVPGRPGAIEISGERLENETIFHIRDNGRGIAQEDMKNVFAPFRRAGKQDVPGEGMGLAYVQTLVRRHGGHILCESEPGVGTTFTFTISAHLTIGADQM